MHSNFFKLIVRLILICLLNFYYVFESDCFLKLHYKNFSGTLQLSRTLGLDCKFFIKFELGDIIFDLIGNKIDLNCSDKIKKSLKLDSFKQNNQSYDDLIARQIVEWYKKINGNLNANIVSANEAHEVMKIIDYCYNNKNRLEY